MPELPEVETVRRGIAPYISERQFRQARVYQPALRWPVPEDLETKIAGQVIRKVDRRGKYLLLLTEDGCLILHLGMSGNLLLTSSRHKPQLHDHVDFVFSGKDRLTLRLHDPRRFSSVHWCETAGQHPLLQKLGPEPLGKDFNADFMYQALRNRSTSIKQALMNHTVVAGVGNIYANEALFLAGIKPTRAANSISRNRIATLVMAVRKILKKAIRCGGSTLRDFNNASGKPGYFQINFLVYGRDGQLCKQCGIATIRLTQKLGGRASYYCPRCQR